MKSNFSDTLRKSISVSDEQQALAVLNDPALFKGLNKKNLVALHDSLLFSMAFAPSSFVKEKSAEVLQKLIHHSKTKELQDSGIANSVVVSSFTLSLLKWMHEMYSGKISFHSFDHEKDDVGEALKLILPSAEAEILSNGWGKNKLFKELCGGKIALQKIISLFSNCADAKLCEYVFSKLALYVTIKLQQAISRSTARSISYPDFFHAEILKKADTEKIISSPLPKQPKISFEEKELLVFSSRMQLAAMGRETDPVTYASVDETEFIVLDRGFSIALFSLLPENRLAFDSYIGYMMFKNGLPIAYGGAWIFFHRALIGINIFDAYRGGESSFLFAQLLRVYHQRYKVNSFSVEPYQYGKDNPEGIASGAYWFYYRFGFRSDDEKLRQIAEKENERIKSEKGYRTPSAILKQFTHSNITLNLAENAGEQNAGTFSLEISKKIAQEFNGDRAKALRQAKLNFENLVGKKFFIPKTRNEKLVFENWSLFLFFFPKRLSLKKLKGSLPKLLIAKATGKETDYITLLQKL